MKIERCSKCGLVLDAGRCERCDFRPKLGRTASGSRRLTPMDLTVDPADLEDDYGDESDANSTARQLEIDGGTAIPTPLQEAMHNERVPQQRRRKSKRSGR